MTDKPSKPHEPLSLRHDQVEDDGFYWWIPSSALPHKEPRVVEITKASNGKLYAYFTGNEGEWPLEPDKETHMFQFGFFFGPLKWNRS